MEGFDGLPEGWLPPGGHATQSNPSAWALGYVKSAAAHALESQVESPFVLHRQNEFHFKQLNPKAQGDYEGLWMVSIMLQSIK